MAVTEPTLSTCAERGCDHRFSPGELRYSASDGRDYCLRNGHGQARWNAERCLTLATAQRAAAARQRILRGVLR